MKELILERPMTPDEAFIMAGRAMALADIIRVHGYMSKDTALAALGVPVPTDDSDKEEEKGNGIF